jgi:hypothetical protein
MKKKLKFNVEEIAALAHRCRGCADPARCCCASFEICVTGREMKRIIGYAEEIVKLCPHLAGEGGMDNIFERIEGGLYALDTDEDGLCVLACRIGGKVRCSLHAIALKLGIPLGEIKPQGCLLWPLSMSEGSPMEISVQEDVFDFPCNKRRACGALDHATLDPGVVEVIRDALGLEVQDVEDLVRENV